MTCHVSASTRRSQKIEMWILNTWRNEKFAILDYQTPTPFKIIRRRIFPHLWLPSGHQTRQWKLRHSYIVLPLKPPFSRCFSICDPLNHNVSCVKPIKSFLIGFPNYPCFIAEGSNKPPKPAPGPPQEKGRSLLRAWPGGQTVHKTIWQKLLLSWKKHGMPGEFSSGRLTLGFGAWSLGPPFHESISPWTWFLWSSFKDIFGHICIYIYNIIECIIYII